MNLNESIPIPKFEFEIVQDFIKKRNIRSEHFDIIRDLLSFSRHTVIVDFHNFFQIYKENSLNELNILMSKTEDVEIKKISNLFLQLVENYDWSTAWNMVVVLEKI